MSLILDALKKSEAERQRGKTPSLLSPLPAIPGPTKANIRPVLPWMIVILLLVAMLVIGFFHVKEKAAAPAVSMPVVLQAARVEAPVKTEPSVVAVPEAMPVVKPDRTAVTIPAAPVIASGPVASAQTDTPLVMPEPEPAESIANLSAMSTEQRQQLPALKLSMHVYSADAGKRFAIIDGQRVNEGSIVGNAVIEQIRQDGVVLSVQGQAYLLPRP